MSWLWIQLHDLFDTDDGSLPEVRVNYAEEKTTVAGYKLLRERAVQTHAWTTGPMVQVGSIYWLAPRWGLTAEVEYIQDLHDHVHEVEGLAGLLYRFGAPTHLAKH